MGKGEEGEGVGGKGRGLNAVEKPLKLQIIQLRNHTYLCVQCTFQSKC